MREIQRPRGSMTLTIGAFSAQEITAAELENGNVGAGLLGALGDGAGKWRLSVSADVDLAVMSLLDTPGGFLTNLSRVVPEVSAQSTATLSFIQDTVFTPSCALSGCHGSPNPAQGMNLTAGLTFSNIVDVPSTQQPSLRRVNPGNPDASYLIRKLEGEPSISGVRMPKVGLSGCTTSCLSQQTIDNIRQWISDGALNDGSTPPRSPVNPGY